jgi:O-phosphoseryl-tRNA(Cys) synthetase
MKDEELRQYADQWVEAKLRDGKTLVGRLVVAAPSSFEIDQPSADLGAGAPRLCIDAGSVEDIRVLQSPPPTLD